MSIKHLTPRHKALEELEKSISSMSIRDLYYLWNPRITNDFNSKVYREIFNRMYTYNDLKIDKALNTKRV